MTAERLLNLARGELGTVEFPPSSNNVKYNSVYYGREVSGENYSWCAVFIWWLFRQTGAASMYYGGEKTAYCPTLLSYHKTRGQAVDGYKPGDIIFFNFKGKTNAAHVGICEAWDGASITTIDGNTGTGNEANGGAVMRRSRAKKYIVGAFRPNYEEEITVTKEEIRGIVWEEMAAVEAERAKLPAGSWAKPYIQKAIDRGLMVENAAGTIDRPQVPATRQELAAALNAVYETVRGWRGIFAPKGKERLWLGCHALLSFESFSVILHKRKRFPDLHFGEHNILLISCYSRGCVNTSRMLQIAGILWYNISNKTAGS